MTYTYKFARRGKAETREVSATDHESLEAFKTQVCLKSDEVDPGESLDWNSLSMGFFLARGHSIDDSERLSRFVRYDLGYWQE